LEKNVQTTLEKQGKTATSYSAWAQTSKTSVQDVKILLLHFGIASIFFVRELGINFETYTDFFNFYAT